MKGKRELIKELQAYLNNRSTMTLSTIGDKGEPQAAPLFFVSDDDLNLYFITDEDSRHGGNIMKRSSVAIAVYGETHDWLRIRGLQIEGRASPINDPILEDRAWSLFKSKFPSVVALASKIMVSLWFVVQPQWIRWIDNRLGFGSKQELFLDDLLQEDNRKESI